MKQEQTTRHSAVIIDDEPNAVRVLEKLLEMHCPDVSVLASETSSLEGLKKIRALRPSIVFLDIEMPQMNGFQLMAELEDMSFHLIFTTAYDQFAVKAFKVNAQDYLLKPIDPEELKTAVNKLLQKPPVMPQQLQHLAELLENRESGNMPTKITLPYAKGFKFITIADIIYCESESNYTVLHIVNEPNITVSKTLGEIAEMLPTPMFLRVHRGFLVNANKIKELIKADGGYLVMENNAQVPISRNKKDELGERMNVKR
jgi:two-component system LytT family response regulator